jgi:hypothetical protein
MAFNRENLVCLGGNSKAGVCPVSYTYWNETTDTVTATGYFADVALRVGDQINVINATYTTPKAYYVSAVASNKATVIASS